MGRELALGVSRKCALHEEHAQEMGNWKEDDGGGMVLSVDACNMREKGRGGAPPS